MSSIETPLPTRRGSDIDFFYELDPADPSFPADRFFGLAEDLEHLLGRTVDLISSRDVRNPTSCRSPTGIG